MINGTFGRSDITHSIPGNQNERGRTKDKACKGNQQSPSPWKSIDSFQDLCSVLADGLWTSCLRGNAECVGVVWSQKLMWPIENTKMTVPSNEKLAKSLKDQIQSEVITSPLKCQFLMFKGPGEASSRRLSFDSKEARVLQFGTKKVPRIIFGTKSKKVQIIIIFVAKTPHY